MLLVLNGADINIKNENGQSAIYLAAENGKERAKY